MMAMTSQLSTTTTTDMHNVKVLSFGYLHDTPPKADITIDLRELLSDPAHRPQGDMLDMTGLDKEVADFVFATPGASMLIHAIFSLVAAAAQIKPITIAIGCAGGRHRSVAFAEKIQWLISATNNKVELEHLHIHLPRVIK